MGIAAGELGGVEAGEMQQFGYAGADALFGPLFEMRDDGDISFHRVMREQARVLDNVADAAAQIDRVPIDCGAPFDHHFAACGLEQAIDQAQGRRFAGAATAEKHEGLSGLNLQAERFEDGLARRRGELHVAKFNGDTVWARGSHRGEANNPARSVSNFCHVLDPAHIWSYILRP